MIFEDEHLLVVDKPAGLNTHAPDRFAGEGLYDWLKHREPRWATLAIIHRLDKETSGIMVFGKTTLANRSLTQQFAARAVRKKYVLLTDRLVPKRPMMVRTSLHRAGERYGSRPARVGGETAETHFRVLNAAFGFPPVTLVEAEPLTGRTHQIRVHAAESGFPILGDTLYGGSPAPRVCLHAAELALTHPAAGDERVFRSPPPFASDARLALRAALIEPEATNAFRLVHGAGDGWPGWYVDRLGDFLLSQSGEAPTRAQQEKLAQIQTQCSVCGAYHSTLPRGTRPTAAREASPQFMQGQPAPERFTIRENGAQFELSFAAGQSVGLFLDQRDNRRRFRSGYIAAGFPLLSSALGPPPAALQMLNAFAYTCGFSVCAALAGARTTSLDLSRKYLEWGRRNFTLNGLDPGAHDFLHGDAFDWLRRLARKGRAFEVVALDPPTFSQSKEQGVFRAERDYTRLAAAALPLLRPGGVLFASTNAAGWAPEKFLAAIESAIRAARREVLQRHYAPQPPDFPISRAEPAHLKTVWLRIR